MSLLLLTVLPYLVSGVLITSGHSSGISAAPSPVGEDSKPWFLKIFTGVHRCRSGGEQRSVQGCLTEAFLESLDSVLEEEQVDINPYVTIVKEKSLGREMDAREDAQSGLIPAIYKRFSRMIDTHSFNLRFYNPDDTEEEKVEGRRRHRHYRKAFPMMVAGYMMMSAFLIPLGFQFMAMIGGKALLLAKMAFFMSLFSGYKRLTNDIEYHHHGHGHGHDLYHHGGYFHHRSAEVPSAAFGTEHQNPFSGYLALRKGRR